MVSFRSGVTRWLVSDDWFVDLGDAARGLGYLSRALVDCRREAASVRLFALARQGQLLLLQELHLLRVGPVEVVQVELLAGAVQLVLGELGGLLGLLGLQLSLALEFELLHLVVALLDLPLVSCIIEDRSLLLMTNYLTTFLVDLRFECRLCPGGSLSSAAFLAFRGRRRCKRSHIKLSCRRC